MSIVKGSEQLRFTCMFDIFIHYSQRNATKFRFTYRAGRRGNLNFFSSAWLYIFFFLLSGTSGNINWPARGNVDVISFVFEDARSYFNVTQKSDKLI